MNDDTYYVYELIDPRTDQPFYIGKGVGDRIDNYIGKSPIVNSFTKTVLEEIALSGKQLIINCVSGSLSEKDAIMLEKKLIAKYGRKTKDVGGILTNIKSSGVLHTQPQTPRTGTYTTIQMSSDINKIASPIFKKHGLRISGVVELFILSVVSASMAGSGSISIPNGRIIPLFSNQNWR